MRLTPHYLPEFQNTHLVALVMENEPNAPYILMKSEPKDGNELGGFVDHILMKIPQ